MKSLVVYYSRTGTTKKVGESISKILKCDLEEVIDAKISRAGVKGWMISGKEAFLKKCPGIKEVKKDLSLYDLVIIGTPVWALTMSSPIRTYISQNKNKFKKVAFFCTHEGMPGNTLKDMEKLCGKKLITSTDFIKKEVINEKYNQKLKKFISEITNLK